VIEPGTQDLRPTGSTELLVIVDYADRWHLTNLTWLLHNALLHHPGVRTRVLLVGRTNDTWPSVRAILHKRQAGTSALELAPLPGATDARRAMFISARDSFAALYRLGNPKALSPPRHLGTNEFGLALALHMAALVAVDARTTGVRQMRRFVHHLPPEARLWVQKVIARDQGQAYGVQGGNIFVYGTGPAAAATDLSVADDGTAGP
jgi:hypothetical protein